MSCPSLSRLAAALTLLVGFMAAACSSSELLPGDAAQVDQAVTALQSSLGPDLAELRQATAQFQNLDKAMAAGWSVPATPCWYHSGMGAMGYHYANPNFIDGKAELLEPEILVFEPRAGGTLKFVALEYIVPIADWTDPDPPELLGRTFARNDNLGLYLLHVWLWRNNPEGIFADWNPTVSCQHAAESEDRG